MSHLAERLPEQVEIGARRIDGQDGLEVVRKDNLRTVRNSRIETEPRRWEISFPICDVDDDTTVYDAVRLMWIQTERGLHTFDFVDFISGDVCQVRFDSEMPIVAPAGHLRHIETITIVEDE